MEDFICRICSKPVSKRKSFAYQDGRACREHPEASNAHDQAEALRVANIAQKTQEKQEADKRRQRRYEPALLSKIQNTCWMCRKDGVTTEEHAIRMLLAIERAEIQKVNILVDRQKMHELAGYDENTLFLVPHVYDHRVKLPYETACFAQCSGTVLLCQHCAKKSGYNVEMRLKQLNQQDQQNKPNISLENMALLGALYESSNLHQEIVEAAKEIESNQNPSC